jgi:hypothetical protein
MPMPPLSDGGIAMPAAKAPSGGSARPSGDEQAPPRMFLPAAFPGACPARGEPFAEDGRNGSRLSGHLRQFGNLCHADGGRPARRPSGTAPGRRCAARPERPALRPVAPLPKGTSRPSGRAGCAGPEGSGRFLPLVRDPVRARLRNPPVSPVANKPQIWNPAT